MKDIKLLDCTLRDGGFVNDWEFGQDDIANIFERSVSAGLDIIEVGLIDERRNFDRNRTIMPDSKSINTIFGGFDTGKSMIVGMIDYGTCSIENICDKKDSILDGIRVIFKKKNLKEALVYCKELKDKGYEMFVQPVSITGYSDEEMIALVEMVNELMPHAMSMVDTYGLLHQSNLLHYFDLIDHHLHKDIAMGYHAHNNFQLGYSNSLALMEKDSNRSIVVDGSAFGIGKGAGNAPLELLAMYANEHFQKAYDINQILENIDVNIMKIYLKAPWGYSLKYYLAASNDCHPDYVKYLMEKRTLSLKSVNEILASIQKSEKLAFNKEHIEALYKEYQNKEINDGDALERLKKELAGHEILVLGPGKSMQKQAMDIQAFIAKKKPVIITINYKPVDFYSDYIFLSNAKRYVGLATKLQQEEGTIKIIATSNVTKVSGNFEYTIDYSSLVDMNFEIIDSSLLMLLRLLIKTGVEKVSLAGFDGYTHAKGENYFNVAMEYAFVNDYAEKLNRYTKETLEQMATSLQIDFITKSKYTE
ncbi:MAG: aldolase catalytic domain-containing protein [Lachnospiraceae bacterium]|nr:aldolase catalytic domain-containing protein [Lachnospiraceae bacterium]